MTKYLVIAVLIAAAGLTLTFDYQKNQRLATERIIALEYRLDKASSEMWVLKTRLEFPEFPPAVCIKMTNKTSMKYATKGYTND